MALAKALVQNGRLNTVTDTLTSVGFGTASADRVITALVSTVGLGTTTSATIGGIVANYTPVSISGAEFGGVTALVPTGTSGSVVMTGSGGFEILGAWALTGGAIVVPSFVGIDPSGVNAYAVNIPANGAVLGCVIDGGSQFNTLHFTSGLIDDGTSFYYGGNLAAQAGSAISASAQILTLSVSGAVFPVIVAMSFAPLLSSAKLYTKKWAVNRSAYW